MRHQRLKGNVSSSELSVDHIKSCCFTVCEMTAQLHFEPDPDVEDDDPDIESDEDDEDDDDNVDDNDDDENDTDDSD